VDEVAGLIEVVDLVTLPLFDSESAAQLRPPPLSVDVTTLVSAPMKLEVLADASLLIEPVTAGLLTGANLMMFAGFTSLRCV
jgi:hypothetical protein